MSYRYLENLGVRLALTWFAVVMLPAASDDALRVWLSLPTADRATTIAAKAKPPADTWLAAYLALLAQPPGQHRLSEVQRLVGRQPPGLFAAYLQLELAAATSAAGRHADAIAIAQTVLDGADWHRLRYDACRVRAVVLAAAGRRDEAAASRREADDIARRELYADPGITLDAVGREVLTDTDPTAWYREADEKRQQAAWNEAARWYRQVQDRTPGDRLAAASVVGLGWCDLGLGTLDQAEQRWTNLIAAEPTGPFRGQAFLALIDTALEERADPARAAQHVQRAERLLAAGAPVDASWEDLPRQIALRRILIHLARGETEQARAGAVRLLAGTSDSDANAQPASPTTFVPARGVGRLAERLASGGSLTPAEVVSERHQAASLRLLLADAWIALEVPDRARRHLALITTDGAKATQAQRIYATMRTADLDRLAWRQEAFRAGYQRTLDLSPRHPWRAHVRLALAVDTYGRLGDESAAIAALTSLARDEPTSPLAQSALWYLGIIPLWAGRWAQADAAFTELDRRYPSHPWHEVIDQAYRPMLREALRSGQWPSGWPDPRPAAEPAKEVK